MTKNDEEPEDEFQVLTYSYVHSIVQILMGTIGPLRLPYAIGEAALVSALANIMACRMEASDNFDVKAEVKQYMEGLEGFLEARARGEEVVRPFPRKMN